jgi:hypothetical protein
MGCWHRTRHCAWPPPPTGAMRTRLPHRHRPKFQRPLPRRRVAAPRRTTGGPCCSHACSRPCHCERRCRQAHCRLHYRNGPGAADSLGPRRAGRAATHRPRPRAARLGRPTGRSRTGLGGPGATVTPVGLQPGSGVVASFRRRYSPATRPSLHPGPGKPLLTPIRPPPRWLPRPRLCRSAPSRGLPGLATRASAHKLSSGR